MPPEANPSAAIQIVVRPMLLDDLDQVVAIDRRSFSLPWPARSFRYELLENDVARLWVAVAAPAVAGVAAEEPQAAPPGIQVLGMIIVWLILDEAHIATIAVHPDFRRLGIAKKLMRTAIQECTAQGAASVTLEVRENNLKAIALYDQLGFAVVGRRRRYYKDTNEDAIIMTLDIKKSENLPGLNGGERESR